MDTSECLKEVFDVLEELISDLVVLGATPDEVVAVVRSVFLMGFGAEEGDGNAVNGQWFRHSA